MDEEAIEVYSDSYCSKGITREPFGDHEITCWGCGLQVILLSSSPIYMCGWCGAITNQSQNPRKPDTVCFSRWRRLRDCSFVSILLLFMFFVICSGIWAVYPVVFSVSYVNGVFHCTVAAILSVITLSTYSLAAFRSAGEPAKILWGSYPLVRKDDLENYSYCTYCEKPKPPRAHHCRSCRKCILDMDHHCPFIGNCVGAANLQFFTAFLISVVISCTYVATMTAYAAYKNWPPLDYGTLARQTSFNSLTSIIVVKLTIAALARSALSLSPRGILLIYLTFASLSVQTSMSVLLWRQLQLIYEGKTYINHISSQNVAHHERGCQNLQQFFGCPYSWWPYPFFRFFLRSTNPPKTQETSSSKLL